MTVSTFPFTPAASAVGEGRSFIFPTRSASRSHMPRIRGNTSRRPCEFSRLDFRAASRLRMPSTPRASWCSCRTRRTASGIRTFPSAPRVPRHRNDRNVPRCPACPDRDRGRINSASGREASVSTRGPNAAPHETRRLFLAPRAPCTTGRIRPRTACAADWRPRGAAPAPARSSR